jgi:hypothetical protein
MEVTEKIQRLFKRAALHFHSGREASTGRKFVGINNESKQKRIIERLNRREKNEKINRSAKARKKKFMKQQKKT